MTERMVANEPVVRDLEDLLEGLKMVRERLNAGRDREGKEVLEQVGHRLASLINMIEPISLSPGRAGG